MRLKNLCRTFLFFFPSIYHFSRDILVIYSYLMLFTQIFYADPVIPNPEMVLTELTTADEFVIMASDGLWDVVSDQDAVNMTRFFFI
jgi:serine/threonine protein phosphatase PrpC